MTHDIIFVLGMHRSGTSLLTKALESMGVHLGDDLLPPVPGDNDKGYFEDRGLVEINEAILTASERSWDSLHLPNPLAEDIHLQQQAENLLNAMARQGSPCALKDPRLCITLPWWLERCARLELRPTFIIALRHPVSVARSLCRPGAPRGEMDEVKAVWLWCVHMVCALQFSAGFTRMAVDYDLMLDNPRHELERLRTSLALPHGPSPEFLHDFLERGLRHSQFARQDLADHPSCNEYILSLYDMVHSLATDTRHITIDSTRAITTAVFAYLDQTGPILRYLSRNDHNQRVLSLALAELRHHLVGLETQRDLVCAERDSLRNTLHAMENSRSWRLTRPLRTAGAWLRTLRQAAKHHGKAP